MSRARAEVEETLAGFRQEVPQQRRRVEVQERVILNSHADG